jgi:hypothetical protein
VTGPCREVEEGATSGAMDVDGAGDRPIGTADPDSVGADSEVDPAPGSSCAATPGGEEAPPGEGSRRSQMPVALHDAIWDAEGIAPDPEADWGQAAQANLPRLQCCSPPAGT